MSRFEHRFKPCYALLENGAKTRFDIPGVSAILPALTSEQQVKAAQIVAGKTSEPTAKDFEEAAEEVQDDKPRVTTGQSLIVKPTTGKASMEALIELIDEVQTMVRVGKPKEAVLGKLKAAADLATRINNGGSQC